MPPGVAAKTKQRIMQALLDLASVPTPRLLGERDVPSAPKKFSEALKIRAASLSQMVAGAGQDVVSNLPCLHARY